MKVGRFEFTRVCVIEPQRNADGAIHAYKPHHRYIHASKIALNPYGNGPFCKFRIPWNYKVAGVYAILTGRKVKYVGECKDLSSRYNVGYGTISPRNCFRGGQETNCRVNNLILREMRSGRRVSLWFLPTNNYKAIEAQILRLRRPDWNKG